MQPIPIRTTVIGSYPFPGWLEFAVKNLDQFGNADKEEMIEDAVIAAIHDQITAGLEQVLKGMPDSELVKISRHLTGRAFDVRPVTANAAAIKADILKLPGLHKFLDKEGGLVRWHAQFQ